MLIKFRKSHFQEHLTIASETTSPYVLRINFKINMNSIFLQNQLLSPRGMLLRMYFVDTKHQSP